MLMCNVTALHYPNSSRCEISQDCVALLLLLLLVVDCLVITDSSQQQLLDDCLTVTPSGSAAH